MYAPQYVLVPDLQTLIEATVAHEITTIVCHSQVTAGLLALVLPADHRFFDVFDQRPGTTIFPSLRDGRPLVSEHIAKLSSAGVQSGDTMVAAAKKLRAVHPSFNPDLY